MATNTIVLIVVAALAMLVLAATAVAITYKTRTLRHDQPHTFRDRLEAEELRAVYEKAVADDDPATAYAAEAEADLTDCVLRAPTAQPAA